MARDRRTLESQVGGERRQSRDGSRGRVQSLSGGHRHLQCGVLGGTPRVPRVCCERDLRRRPSAICEHLHRRSRASSSHPMVKPQADLSTPQGEPLAESAERPPARNRMDRFIDGIELIAAAFVGIVAADTFIAVLLRYFFSVSIPDSYDFGRLLL